MLFSAFLRAAGRVPAAILVAMLAFLLYHGTMLPGLELGDSASFQIRVGSPVLTPRDGYPLYFALGGLLVWASGGDPAGSLNLASVVFGAIAIGLVVAVGSELAGSVFAGAAAALLFAGSYTFWSQAVIAEVYTLHILLVALTMLLLLHWSRQPTIHRFAWFLAAYAASFGNHLSMILLAPSYAIFVLATVPGGWRTLLRSRTIVLIGGLTVAGSLQYLWNLRALWYAPAPPATLWDALDTFWFDVTKSDWRDTMVLGLPASQLVDRLWMYTFDLRQQFAFVVPALAFLGALRLVRTDPRRAALVISAYMVCLIFALGYNVGDAHVFFLPSHLMLALLAAPGLVSIEKALAARGAVVAVVLIVAGTRIYHDYPALDRSSDRRPTNALDALTSGLDERHAVLLTDLDWQLENGLNYFAKMTRPNLLYARVADVMLYAPAFIRDNGEIGRRVIVSDRARERLEAAYGPLLSSTPDETHVAPRLIDLVRDLPRGTPYVLCVLRPLRELSLDGSDLSDSLRQLTGGRVSTSGSDDYSVVAGTLGDETVFRRSSSAPFRTALSLRDLDVEVRMDSWLAFDTIRRMGFGHVIVGRRHALIVERGISFAAFDSAGRVVRSGYAAGIFASQPRYIVRLTP